MQREGGSSAFWTWSQALAELVATALVLLALGLIIALVVYMVIAVGSAVVEQNSGFTVRLY
jgi:hypothetical protein